MIKVADLIVEDLHNRLHDISFYFFVFTSTSVTLEFPTVDNIFILPLFSQGMPAITIMRE
jgi:hypothetical protein